MTTKVVGDARLKATMKAAGAAMAGPGMTPAVRAAEQAMTRSVKRRTPRRTGALAASIRPAPAGGLSAAVTSGVSYAAPREYGVGPRAGLRGGHNIRPARMFAQGMTDATAPAVEATAAAVRAVMRRVKGA